MSKRLLSSLGPYICRDCRARLQISSTQSRHFSTSKQPPNPPTISKKVQALDNVETVERRIARLGGKDALASLFPRWSAPTDAEVLSAAEFSTKYAYTPESQRPAAGVTVYGRVIGRRSFGINLLFLDISTANDTSSIGTPAQVAVNQIALESANHTSLAPKAVKEFERRIKRGDWIAVTGTLKEDNEGYCRINATRMPIILAPALQQIPLALTDAEFRMRNRHVDQIVNPSSRDFLYLRSQLINGIRQYLQRRDFIEVNTPLLVADAGGAVARPFKTVATEFLDLNLNLRVAPELFLKRMIVGGMQKVFEIGPAFRNEGVDATHNPEFTICEFYSVMTNLEDLMKMTEDLFRDLYKLAEQVYKNLESLTAPSIDFAPSFKRLDFIPSIETAVREHIPNWTFPDLTTPGAMSSLTETAITLKIQLPLFSTVPRLLDAYAAHFLEPQCQSPTFITHHPECMSPLAKSFLREPASPDGIRHRVSARAELFIQGREYVNCYEEENSPIEQRRKFEEQLLHRNKAEGEDAAETHAVVDESYVRVLEWGMPPTGGWGCGVDRIIMLFGGKSRIADVLPFGNLRNVVGLGSAMREMEKEKEKGVLAATENAKVGKAKKHVQPQWPSAESPVVQVAMKTTHEKSGKDVSGTPAELPVMETVVKAANEKSGEDISGTPAPEQEGSDLEQGQKQKKTTMFAAPKLLSFKDIMMGGRDGERSETKDGEAGATISEDTKIP